MILISNIKKLYKEYYTLFISKSVGNCGKNLKCYSTQLFLKNKKNIFFGDNVKLNEYCYLYPRSNAKIILKDNSTISAFAKLITATYDVEKYLFDDNKNYKDIHSDKSIIIGENCWVGANAMILPGVELRGHGIIVGAGSVVTKSFDEDYVLIAGNPAKIMKKFNKAKEYE